MKLVLIVAFTLTTHLAMAKSYCMKKPAGSCEYGTNIYSFTLKKPCNRGSHSEFKISSDGKSDGLFDHFSSDFLVRYKFRNTNLVGKKLLTNEKAVLLSKTDAVSRSEYPLNFMLLCNDMGRKRIVVETIQNLNKLNYQRVSENDPNFDVFDEVAYITYYNEQAEITATVYRVCY